MFGKHKSNFYSSLDLSFKFLAFCGYLKESCIEYYFIETSQHEPKDAYREPSCHYLSYSLLSSE